jgi:hypothetical protein
VTLRNYQPVAWVLHQRVIDQSKADIFIKPGIIDNIRTWTNKRQRNIDNMLVNPATIIKYVREYGRAKKDNTEKLATYGTQDEENKNKNTTQYLLDTTMRKQTQKT